MSKKPFKSIDRDIREHEFEHDNFAIGFSDSTDPFQVISSQLSDPDYEYAFVLNDPSRVMTKRLEKYEIVDPSLMLNRADIFKQSDRPDCITVGDLIYMRRPKQYRAIVEERHRAKNYETLSKVLSEGKTTEPIHNIESPFSV